MSFFAENPVKARPYSADVSSKFKVRLQTSNCPTILKHEVTSPTDTVRPFTSISERPQLVLDRPQTTKAKFAVLQSMKTVTSPAHSMRPMSGVTNSTINFDFLSSIGKIAKGKFQDKSKIRPVRKLQTDSIHSVLYKVKQEKEALEQDINRMELWHRDFKENDVWNTPQTTIIDSILRQTANANPEGNVSRFLQNERELKERDNMIRANKRNGRPVSAYSNISKSVKNAKSVADFFINEEDDDEEIIEEIIGKKKLYKNQYEHNKKKITEKINNYVDNIEGSNRGLQPKLSRPLSGLRPQTEQPSQSVYVENQQDGKSITEIMESSEQSEVSPMYKLDNIRSNPSFFDQKSELKNAQKGRPFSAKVGINTALSPKNFGGGFIANQGMPSAIHTRPHTAKQMRFAANTPLTQLAITTSNEDLRQQQQQSMSVYGMKFVPLMMEGQRMQIEPYNLSVQRFFNQTMSSKGSSTRDDPPPRLFSAQASRTANQFKGNLSTTSFKSAAAQQNVDFVSERDQVKSSVRSVRPGTAKPNLKTTAGTQTPGTEGGNPIGKVNIDGEYFQAFSATVKSSGNSTRKNVLESWVSRENHPRGQPTQE